jgi:hypothetical protein
MEEKLRKSGLAGMPAWLLSILAFVVSFLLLLVLGSLFGSLEIFSGKNGEAAGYIFYDILIAVACFFICRIHPKSYWYTPLICGAPCIIAAIIEPTFWTTSLGLLMGGGFIVAVLASILGAISGRRLSERDLV